MNKNQNKSISQKTATRRALHSLAVLKKMEYHNYSSESQTEGGWGTILSIALFSRQYRKNTTIIQKKYMMKKMALGFSINPAQSDILQALMIDLTSCLEYFAQALVSFSPPLTLWKHAPVWVLSRLCQDKHALGTCSCFSVRSHSHLRSPGHQLRWFSVRGPLPTLGGQARDRLAGSGAATRRCPDQTAEHPYYSSRRPFSFQTYSVQGKCFSGSVCAWRADLMACG